MLTPLIRRPSRRPLRTVTGVARAKDGRWEVHVERTDDIAAVAERAMDTLVAQDVGTVI